MCLFVCLRVFVCVFACSLFPCEESECALMKDMMELFVECVMFSHSKLDGTYISH